MRRLLSTLAALTLLLAACGGNDDAAEAPATTTSTQAPATTTSTAITYGTAGTGAEPGAGAAAVTISEFAFDPGTIEVTAGDTVTWTNEDGVAHTVTAGSPGAATDGFDEKLDAGGRAEVTFAEAGTYDYFCAIHPTMTGQVVVS